MHRRLLESFRARDRQGREYDIEVYAEPRPGCAGDVEWVGTATARVAGTYLALPAVRVEGDVYQLQPGGLELTRVRG